MPTIDCPICNKKHNVRQLERKVIVNGTEYKEVAYSCGDYLFYTHELLIKNFHAFKESKGENV